MIFPEKASTQFWDLLIIGFTVYNAFFIPYQFGMSGGYYKMTSDLFVVFSFVVDLIFFGELKCSCCCIYCIVCDVYLIGVELYCWDCCWDCKTCSGMRCLL